MSAMSKRRQIDEFGFLRSGLQTDSPDTGSGTDIKNALGVLSDGGKVELASEKEKENLVVDIETVLLGLVGGQHVLVLTEVGVVTTSFSKSSV